MQRIKSRRLRRGETRSMVIMFMIVAFFVLLMYFPIYYMIISSVKNNVGILTQPFVPAVNPIWNNYVESAAKIAHYLKNSVIVTVYTVGGILIVGTMAAYVFARFEFPFKGFLYMLIMSFMMIPGILTLVPQFVLVNRLGLMGGFAATVLPSIAGGEITFIIFLRSSIEGVPGDLFEEASIEGAKHWQIFTHIVFPLVKPVILSLCLIAFLNSWNDFIWPLLTLSADDSKKTIILGLYSYMDLQRINYGPMYAGFVLASVPLVILFSFNMKYFVSGLTLGAVKG